MSDLITKEDGSPFATMEAVKSKRTRMGEEGLDTNIVQVDGGYALENKPYEKPKKRIPLGRRSVLGVDPKIKDPNYEYRVVTDKSDGRINMFRDAGWALVEKRGEAQIGEHQVGTDHQLGATMTKSLGGNEIGYLMRIKKEFYKEDQNAKARQIDEQEAGLKMEKNKQGLHGKLGIEQEKK